ncbi:sugar transferase [Paenibacillus thermoaerophilus]|uniref:Sugar transferase n=1 Tax=Paenibacillus thermoaerophilus TaxID=1215385 RepID=A0ABW2UZ56_9BACL|nr:sugar transferase [Paenibacillus thermoaerophilus]TMV17488.1 sugar transferase [Paenibacillus thermoaerophilus]
MSTQVQIDPSMKAKLRIAEDIVTYKRKRYRIEMGLNLSLIALEYLLYLVCFLALFQYRVLPQYGELDWNDPIGSLLQVPILQEYGLLLAVIFTVYTGILYQRGLFRWNRDIKLVDDTITSGKAVAVSFLIALGFVFFLQTGIVYSRLLILLLAFSMTGSFFVSRTLRLGVMMLLKKYKYYNKNILVVGAGRIGEQIKNRINASLTNGSRFVGFLDDFKSGPDILGKIPQIEQIVRQHQIHEIYITIPSAKNAINQMIASVRKYDVEIKIIPELFELVTSSVSFDQVYDYPCIDIVRTPLRGLNWFMKRCADFFLSALGLLIVSPIMLAIAVWIKLDSPGPVIIKQKRIGKNGAPFHMFKFRSMVADAEALKASLASLNEAQGPVFKIKKDPRVTRVGRIIRKYSLDELPQLFNVLLGQMSLVGPRPPLPNEVELYSDYQWRRFDVRPGITGLWQVSGRSDLPFEEWVRLDIYYIEHWSLRLEFKILLKTIPVVLKGEGAY